MQPSMHRNPTSPLSPPARDGDPSIWSYGIVVLRWKKLLLYVPLLCAALAITYSVLSPREFTAQASFLPVESGSKSSLAGLAATLGVSQLGALGSLGGGSTASPQFYADLLSARELELAAIRTVYATRAPAEPFKGTLIQYFKLTDDDSVRREVKALKKLNSDVLAVSFDRLTGVVHFTVKTKNPGLSALVARRLLDLTNEFNLQRRKTQYSAEREFVEQQSGEAAAALRAAEDDLTAFQLKNRNMMTSAPMLAAEQQRRSRAVDLARQVYVNLMQQQAMTRMEAVRSTPTIAVIDTPESLVEPSRPHPIVAALAGFMAGVVLVIVFAFVAESVAQARERHADEYAELVRLRGRSAASR